MSRRRRSSTSTPRGSSASSAPATTSGSRDGSIIGLFIAILFAVRYFLPAESAALGETLWIVQLWLIAGVLWFWMRARGGESPRSPDGFDLGLALLVGGHVLSAVLVLVAGGDRRAALNMLWEWIGLGVTGCMLRDAVSRSRGQALLLNLLVIASVTLAGLGLWQHHVWYPQLSDKLAEFDRLRSTPVATPLEAQQRDERLRDLRQELGPVLIEDDPAANRLMRARVEDSTEPIGRFALANTLAGLLLVALLVGSARLWQVRFNEGLTPRLVLAAIALVVTAYAFWLTKSRTAVVGLIAGLVVWMIAARRSRQSDPAGSGFLQSGWGAWVVVLCLVGLPVVAGLMGSLDRQVVTEAPKSLQYRLEYWTATGSVIRQAPLFGVGPGNFRQAYLAHKLPGSSEEVLDPHNLFLDVWANGGLIGLAGLILLLVFAARHARRKRGDGVATHIVEVPRPWRIGLIRSALGLVVFLLAGFVELMNGVNSGADLWGLLAAWCLVSWVWPSGRFLGQSVVAVSAVALSVHLMGAGGIAMPAILQTMLLLMACLGRDSRDAAVPSASSVSHSDVLPWQMMAGAGICLCLAVACAFTATLPVSEARTRSQLGRAILLEGGSIPSAISAFEAAIEADPLAAEPWQELALAHATQWQRLGQTDETAFQHAVSAHEEAIRHDPHGSAGWMRLGDLWWKRHQSRPDSPAAEEALAAYQAAAQRYPNLATLQAKLALAAAATGRSELAEMAASRGLTLDEANRGAGHIDKYLSDAERQSLLAILEDESTGL